MTLSDLDQGLLERCLDYKPRAWEDFIDRFLGLVLHVIDHATGVRRIRLTPAERDELCVETFAAIRHNDYQLLRNYHGQCHLATFLTVTTRRIIVRAVTNRGYITVSDPEAASFAQRVA
ncbi:MAG TPA: hypothetical protein DEB39_08300 [Planctomycetaceae bacterium]|nr:hypothetical protein [Planctomycetaceae bacterium]